MGMDLTLLPLDGTYKNSEGGVTGYSFTVLRCDRNYQLFDEIRRLQKTHGVPAPDKFYCYLAPDDSGGRCSLGSRSD